MPDSETIITVNTRRSVKLLLIAVGLVVVAAASWGAWWALDYYEEDPGLLVDSGPLAIVPTVVIEGAPPILVQGTQLSMAELEAYDYYWVDDLDTRLPYVSPLSLFTNSGESDLEAYRNARRALEVDVYATEVRMFTDVPTSQVFGSLNWAEIKRRNLSPSLMQLHDSIQEDLAMFAARQHQKHYQDYVSIVETTEEIEPLMTISELSSFPNQRMIEIAVIATLLQDANVSTPEEVQRAINLFTLRSVGYGLTTLSEALETYSLVSQFFAIIERDPRYQTLLTTARLDMSPE